MRDIMADIYEAIDILDPDHWYAIHRGHSGWNHWTITRLSCKVVALLESLRVNVQGPFGSRKHARSFCCQEIEGTSGRISRHHQKNGSGLLHNGGGLS